MAKISAYPLRPNLTGNEDGILADNGHNYRFKLSQLKTLFTKADVGLGNVDNTADADKPLSTATTQALAGKSNTGHGHQITDVQGLGQALTGKSDVGHHHDPADVDGLNQALADKSNVGHGHSTSDIQGLDTALTGKAPVVHQHSQNDVQGLTDSLAGLQTQINNRALSTHSHATGDVNGLEGYIQEVVTDMGVTGDIEVGELQW